MSTYNKFSKLVKFSFSTVVLCSSIFVFAGCAKKNDAVLTYVNDLFNNKDSGYSKTHKDERTNIIAQLNGLTGKHFNNFHSIYSVNSNPFKPPTKEKPVPNYVAYNNGINPYKALADELGPLTQDKPVMPTNYTIQPYFELATDGSNMDDVTKGVVSIDSSKTYMVSLQMSIGGVYLYPTINFKIDPNKHTTDVSLPGDSQNNVLFGNDNAVFSNGPNGQYEHLINLANDQVSDKKEWKGEKPFAALSSSENLDPKVAKKVPDFPYFLTTSKDFQIKKDKDRWYVSGGSFWFLAILKTVPTGYTPKSFFDKAIVWISLSKLKYDSSKGNYTSASVSWQYYGPYTQIVTG
ncbi:hypothetical protein [Mycoplasma sp. SG1]|uniref:hypothetical protein n=1 Tax=Mycoplasma sp. SG1 TaxID=2810348 RepID=UPI0020250784|nr:hypothetical protein [Mycoplasma sp. SG1]URM53040.1 hypothetical protein JRW51_01695 [Mycoplasma sp. SG1]